jgi:hypothetical protein
VVEETEREEEGEKRRGPKGGMKHTPGRGHARKSQPHKKKEIGKRLRENHRKRRKMAEKRRKAWESLSPELRKLLRPEDLEFAEEDK